MKIRIDNKIDDLFKKFLEDFFIVLLYLDHKDPEIKSNP